MTFSQDLLGRKGFCDRLERFLDVEKDYVEGGLVVAINGRFGSGKSALIEMWHNSISEQREGGGWSPMPVILNAWESDHCGDPMIAILSGLIAETERWGKLPKAQTGKLKQAAKDVAWFSVAVANEIASKVGFDPIAAGEFAEKKKTKPVPDFIAAFNQRMDAMRNLKASLAQTFGGETSKAIVFVDELDRCRPDYAISYLETIKHVFDVKGMIFVLAIDYSQLENSARALFGPNLDPSGYFSKFYHRLFNLETNSEAFEALVEPYFRRYMEIEGKRRSGWKLCANSVTPLEALVKGLGMTPRQIQEAFRIMGHTLSTVQDKVHNNLLWAIGAGVALLCFLKVGHPGLYEKISRKEADHKEVLGLLRAAEADRYEWWRDLYLTGICEAKDRQTIEGFMMVDGGVNATDLHQTLRHFSDGWGRLGRIPEFCRMIEEARSF